MVKSNRSPYLKQHGYTVLDIVGQFQKQNAPVKARGHQKSENGLD